MLDVWYALDSVLYITELHFFIFIPDNIFLYVTVDNYFLGLLLLFIYFNMIVVGGIHL